MNDRSSANDVPQALCGSSNVNKEFQEAEILQQPGPSASSTFGTETHNEKPATTHEEKISITYRLVDESLSAFRRKVDEIAGSSTAIAALRKFSTRMNLCKSEGQFLSALNNFGSQIWQKNAGKRIRFQPASVSRRRADMRRCSAPLSRGRPSKQVIGVLRKKRSRNLGANVRLNLINAKTLQMK